MKRSFRSTPEDRGVTLAALLRRHIEGLAWNRARALIHTGRVLVDGAPQMDDAYRISKPVAVEVDEAAPKKRPLPPGKLLYDDAHVVVLDKPSGISSVPYEERETGTAMDLVRDHWRALGRKANEVALHIVHRIDKDTSGLLAFALSKTAERVLAAQFRTHTVERQYVCVVHGKILPRRIESYLVEDRGDGLRGSAKGEERGKRAVTHILHTEPVGEVATLCTIQLETGKTHQIRIHLAEAGHPIIGETVYVRDYRRRVGEPIESPRLLLHAATIGFTHPVSGESIHLESPLPDDFTRVLDALAKQRASNIVRKP